MPSAAETSSSKQSIELSRIEQLISETINNENPLLPDIKQLYDAYRQASGKIETLLLEKTMLEQKLLDINRSLDLATRIDPMTGLANRRSIMEKIDQEFSRAQRHQRSFSIILMNIDNYRVVNDTYGYNAGDDVLVEIARILRCSMRSEDICARWGGAEFLILLPETTAEGALAFANKIRESIDMTEFRANKPGIHITASLGVSEFTPDMNILECVRRAEQALKKAQTSGKNRAIIANQDKNHSF